MSDWTPPSFQVSYGDCDTVGIVYFATYFPWMERAYSTFLWSHGLRSGSLLEDHGFLTVGVSAQCDFRAMVRLFDELTVQPVLRRIGTSSYVVGYDVVRAADSAVVARGAMTFVCRDADGAALPVPPVLREVLEALPAGDPA